MSKSIITILFAFYSCYAFAQGASISGVVSNSHGELVSNASVFLRNTSFKVNTNAQGAYEIGNVPNGNYTLVCFHEGMQTIEKTVNISEVTLRIDFILVELESTLQEVVVSDQRVTTGITRLQAVENFGINEAKKNEVIVLRDLTANTATNNARQIYSKITGLNIWESDQAGLQLGIGGRGLNPNRTSNFNTRQNGYDISADALGYPESYYTPPAEALEKIEIIRGAASLQYGTQFGGMVNFRFKRGSDNKKIEFLSRQTAGSWGFFGSFNSIGGTVAKGKLNYYAYYNYKRGDGYRPNAGFNFHNAFASITYNASEKLSVNVDLTKMTYLAQQPGGLTDKLFEDNPRQSVRARNWFQVDWSLLAVNFTYRFTPQTQLNVRNFGLLAQRQSLGNLSKINVADFGDNRTLIDGEFKNFGSEARLLHRYKIAKRDNALLVGIRAYRGTSTAIQGDGSNGNDADFRFLNPNDVENSSYTFPNTNYSFFAENVFDLTKKISITPGLRFENIQTFASGYYKRYVFDGAGNILVENRIEEDRNRKRSFLIAGLGISYKIKEDVELYGNFSQNYRAINFTDLRIVNPSIDIDSTIQDEKGYTADLGIRGNVRDVFNYELTGFYLAYRDKIGQVWRDKLFRGNISDARIIGIEAFGEVLVSKLIDIKPLWSVFVNTSLTNGRYINSEDTSIDGNQVEMVPPVILRTGSTFKWKQLSFTAQYAYSAQHFSDAINSKQRTAAAIVGLIPTYGVVDLSASYTYKKFTLEGSCNNVLNEKYFTRRADSYPGPGIIPADGRGFYLTLMGKF